VDAGPLETDDYVSATESDADDDKAEATARGGSAGASDSKKAEVNDSAEEDEVPIELLLASRQRPASSGFTNKLLVRVCATHAHTHVHADAHVHTHTHANTYAQRSSTRTDAGRACTLADRSVVGAGKHAASSQK
jgi:ABC-type nickel/cobalt efflux system permease component RcnA